MDRIDNFFLLNSIENLRNRFLNQKLYKNKNIPSYFNLNVANIGSINKMIHRSNFLEHEMFSDNAVFSTGCVIDV